MAFDFKKEYKEFYLPKTKPALVTVPPMNYLAVRGKGDPNEENGVDREHRSLPLESEQQQRHVEQHQKEGQREIIRRQLGQQDRCSGNAAVIQLHRCNEQRNTNSVDDTRDEQHQKIEGREFGKQVLFQGVPP